MSKRFVVEARYVGVDSVVVAEFDTMDEAVDFQEENAGPLEVVDRGVLHDVNWTRDLFMKVTGMDGRRLGYAMRAVGYKTFCEQSMLVLQMYMYLLGVGHTKTAAADIARAIDYETGIYEYDDGYSINAPINAIREAMVARCVSVES